jgi:hypothetical protein
LFRASHSAMARLLDMSGAAKWRVLTRMAFACGRRDRVPCSPSARKALTAGTTRNGGNTWFTMTGTCSGACRLGLDFDPLESLWEPLCAEPSTTSPWRCSTSNTGPAKGRTRWRAVCGLRNCRHVAAQMTMDCTRFVPAAGARQQQKPGSATVRNGGLCLDSSQQIDQLSHFDAKRSISG